MNIDKSVMWAPGMKLDHLEKMVILKAFGYYQNNKTMTANALGISIRTLDNKLEKYNLDNLESEAANESERNRQLDFLIRSRGQVPTVPTNTQGLYAEPIANTGAQSKMPMPKRAKV